MPPQVECQRDARPVLCPVCGSQMMLFGDGPYRLPKNTTITTDLYRCYNCTVLYRDVSAEQVANHYDAVTYTDPKFERRFYEQRFEYFRFILSLAAKYGSRLKTCLDFGCSYGHLMLLLRGMGCDTYGIESCEQARACCQRHGLRVCRSVEEIEPSQRFDLITLLDSLYYVSDPKPLLRNLRERLADGGLLVIRVGNRNWLLRALRLSGYKNGIGEWLGDAVVGFNKRSLALLLQKTGYRIIHFRYWETGKTKQGWARKLFYWAGATCAVVSLGNVSISPGIIVLATKASSS